MTEDRRTADESDAPFDRVRAADPAATVEPDVAALVAAVQARIAEPEDELAAARGRRRPRVWLPIAAAAAGALVFASAGYALGNGTGSDSSENTAAAVISLGQGAADQSTALLGPPEAAKSAADGRDTAMIWPGYGGRTVFAGAGLSDDGGTATAWAYDPAPVFSAATLTTIAQALGIAGEPALVDGAWMVGPVDGSGPSLSLQPDALASVNFYDPGMDPFACAATVPESLGGGSDGSTGTEPVAPADGVTKDLPVSPPLDPGQACTTDRPNAPQDDAAIAKAKDVLASIGIDTAALEFETQDSGMSQSSYVNAFQVVDGQRTGATWSVSLVGDGVQSLSGSLARVVSLGSYDVVSPSAAVARLSDPRFGSSYGGPMYAMAKGAVAEGAAGADSTVTAPDTTSEMMPVPERTLPPTAQPGSAFSWPVQEVTLTSARLGLTMSTQADGSTVLLPAYELSSDDGQAWSVVAVADTKLDFSPAG